MLHFEAYVRNALREREALVRRSMLRAQARQAARAIRESLLLARRTTRPGVLPAQAPIHHRRAAHEARLPATPRDAGRAAATLAAHLAGERRARGHDGVDGRR